MATFNEVLQNYVNLSYEQLVAIGKESLCKMALGLDKFFDGDDDTGATALLVFVSSILGADGRLTTLECRFLNDLLEADHSYDSVCEMVAAFSNQEHRDLTDRLIDSLDDETKAEALAVALCFCAVDETISREEVAYFKKLMD